ncbi:MAG: hypothetical protein CYPHOPRED_000269 [Cyphobasidiales sp. Tagirdzhanova-0007]|nr:MAG: hypothetical protein CYPHOPRED_000269 [Cyphobasidiales sp. Tagirdzhanova-0007]
MATESWTSLPNVHNGSNLQWELAGAEASQAGLPIVENISGEMYNGLNHYAIPGEARNGDFHESALYPDIPTQYQPYAQGHFPPQKEYTGSATTYPDYEEPKSFIPQQKLPTLPIPYYSTGDNQSILRTNSNQPLPLWQSQQTSTDFLDDRTHVYYQAPINNSNMLPPMDNLRSQPRNTASNYVSDSLYSRLPEQQGSFPLYPSQLPSFPQAFHQAFPSAPVARSSPEFAAADRLQYIPEEVPVFNSRWHLSDKATLDAASISSPHQLPPTNTPLPQTTVDLVKTDSADDTRNIDPQYVPMPLQSFPQSLLASHTGFLPSTKLDSAAVHLPYSSNSSFEKGSARPSPHVYTGEAFRHSAHNGNIPSLNQAHPQNSHRALISELPFSISEGAYAPSTSLNQPRRESGRTTGSSQQMKQKRESRKIDGVCKVCGARIATIYLRGTSSDFIDPYVLDYTCMPCTALTTKLNIEENGTEHNVSTKTDSEMNDRKALPKGKERAPVKKRSRKDASSLATCELITLFHAGNTKLNGVVILDMHGAQTVEVEEERG